MENNYNYEAAQECLKKSLEIITRHRNNKHNKDGAKESNLRHSFTSYLRLISPSKQWWIEDHISRGESNAAFSIADKTKSGFVDNLVGLTAIEYETDLENAGKFTEGLNQVKNYCASLINEGRDPNLVIGVLSDTIRWRAYKIKKITRSSGIIGGEHLELEEIESIDLYSSR